MTTLLNSLLQNALLGTGLALLVWTSSHVPAVRRRPGLRHLLWVIVLLKLVTPPLLEVSLLPASIAAEPQQPNHPPAVVLEGVSESPVALNRTVALEMSRKMPYPRSLDWPAVLAVASGLGTLTVLLLAIRQVWQLRRVLAQCAANDDRLGMIVRRSARHMGLSAPPTICVVSANMTPLLWVRRAHPLVVVPRRLVDQMSDEQLGCVVSHEIAHYLRRDHWTNLLSLIVAAICWWNPVVWWMCRELRMAQEACCDALVISRSVASRRKYAETLFQALEFLQAERSLLPALASGFGSKSSTERRFEMIANPHVNHHLSWWSYPVLLTALAVLPCIPVRGDSESETTQADQKSTASNDQNTAKQITQLWKLQAPSGSEYYLELKGFEGKFVEAWWQGGSGVVFDTREPEDIPEDERGYQATLEMATGGQFPEWIRAYRFNTVTKEFDGSWYTFSIDTHSGKVVVREAVDADLAAELRRKVAGIPVLLPDDAKVWRIVIDEQLQRPSKLRAARTEGDKIRFKIKIRDNSEKRDRETGMADFEAQLGQNPRDRSSEYQRQLQQFWQPPSEYYQPQLQLYWQLQSPKGPSSKSLPAIEIGPGDELRLGPNLDITPGFDFAPKTNEIGPPSRSKESTATEAIVK